MFVAISTSPNSPKRENTTSSSSTIPCFVILAKSNKILATSVVFVIFPVTAIVFPIFPDKKQALIIASITSSTATVEKLKSTDGKTRF